MIKCKVCGKNYNNDWVLDKQGWPLYYENGTPYNPELASNYFCEPKCSLLHFYPTNKDHKK